MGVLAQGKLKGAPLKIQWWEENSALVIIHCFQGKMAHQCVEKRGGFTDYNIILIKQQTALIFL